MVEADGMDNGESVDNRTDLNIKVSHLTKEQRICVNALKTLANQIAHSEGPLPEELRRHGLVACAELRRINREMQMIAQMKREETFAQRQKLENKFLILHNLLYEKARVQEEIDRCLGIEALDQNIKLIDIDDFYRTAPIEISQPEATKENEHARRIARLKWELKQRQQLNSLVNDLKSENKHLSDQVQADSAKAEGVWPKLTAIETACQTMKEYMHSVMPPEETTYGEMLEVSKLLPQLLYNLYSMVIAYVESNDNFLRCAVKSIETELDDLPDTDEIHPYSVVVILQRDRLELPMQFRYLTKYKVVCVRLSKGKNEEEYLGPFLSNLLDVFEISDGPPESIALPRKLTCRVGLPYLFAQYMAGSMTDPKSKITFHQIIADIRNKLDCRCRLNKIVSELAGSHPTDVVCKSPWPKMNVSCKIDSWTSTEMKDLEQDEYLSAVEREDLKLCTVFKCRIRRDKVCLNSYIAIPPDFPDKPPRPLLQIVKKDGTVVGRNCSSDLKRLESAVRSQVTKTGATAEMLMAFVKCLMVCFDVLVSSRPDLSGNQRQTANQAAAIGVVRGRWRDLPFFIDEETGMLEH